MVISEDTVLNVFKAINARKTCGADGVCGRVLKRCANELCAIFRFSFQASMDLCKIPFTMKEKKKKRVTVIPFPKTLDPASLNHFRPVPLTSSALKCSEKIGKTGVLKRIKHILDPLQLRTGMGKGGGCHTCLLYTSPSPRDDY